MATIGAPVQLPFRVLDADGDPVDPATMSIEVTQPDGTTQTLAIDAGITRQTEGDFYGLFTPTQPGRHTWWGWTTGPVTALDPDAFNVTAAADAPVVGLAEARGWLNLNSTDHDRDLRAALARATELAEWWLDETLRRTVVTGEVRDGGGRCLKLWKRPVIEVTAVTENGDTLSATDGVDWTLHAETGLLYRGGPTSTSVWYPGVNTVTVDYVAGSKVIGDKELGAVHALTKEIYGSLQDSGMGNTRNGRRTDGPDEYDDQHNPSLTRICALLLGPRISDL